MLQLQRSHVRTILSLAVVALLTSDLSGQEPLRREGHALGASVVIRASGPDWGLLDVAIADSLTYLESLEVLVDGREGSLAEISDRAKDGPQPVPQELFDVLQRANWYCLWSEGRHGPLGAYLYASWGLRQAVAAMPVESGLAEQRDLASCSRLRIDPNGQRVSLASPSRLDLWGFERGFAVDSILDHLASKGVTNVSVSIGNVQGARGNGPTGTGWSLTVPLPSQLADLYDKVLLQNESLAVASRAAARMTMGGVTFPPYLDQRTGRPTEGVAATLAASEKAVDAEALAASAYLAGSRVGSHLVAQLRPKPSILWWLGSGQGEGLLTDYHWSRMVRPRAR